MRFLNYCLLALALLVGITFASLNAQSVAINYYVGTLNLPVSLLVVIALGLGLLAGFVLSTVKLLRLKCENRQLKKEVSNLRAIPLQDKL